MATNTTQLLQYEAAAGTLPTRELITAAECWMLICSDTALTDQEQAWLLQHPLFDKFSATAQANYAAGLTAAQIYEAGLEQLDELINLDTTDFDYLNTLRYDQAAKACEEFREQYLNSEELQRELDQRWMERRLAISTIKADQAKKTRATKQPAPEKTKPEPKSELNQKLATLAQQSITDQLTWEEFLQLAQKASPSLPKTKDAARHIISARYSDGPQEIIKTPAPLESKCFPY